MLNSSFRRDLCVQLSQGRFSTIPKSFSCGRDRDRDRDRVLIAIVIVSRSRPDRDSVEVDRVLRPTSISR